MLHLSQKYRVFDMFLISSHKRFLTNSSDVKSKTLFFQIRFLFYFLQFLIITMYHHIMTKYHHIITKYHHIKKHLIIRQLWRSIMIRIILLFWYEYFCRQEQELFDLKKAVLRPKDTKDEKQTLSTKETLQRVNALHRYIKRWFVKISKQSIPNKIHISIFICGC